MWHEPHPPSSSSNGVPQVCSIWPSCIFNVWLPTCEKCDASRGFVWTLSAFLSVFICSSACKWRFLLLKVTAFVKPACAFHFLSVSTGTAASLWFLSFSFYGHCCRRSGSGRAFKKLGTFRICGDNPEIPSSWIMAVFYSPWHEGPGSLKAERQHEATLCFICCPIHVSSPNESC